MFFNSENMGYIKMTCGDNVQNPNSKEKYKIEIAKELF